MIFYGKNALPLHIINIIERKKQRAKSDQIQLKSVLLHKINISGDGLHSKLSTTSKQLKEDVNEKGISHFCSAFYENENDVNVTLSEKWKRNDTGPNFDWDERDKHIVTQAFNAYLFIWSTSLDQMNA